MDFSRFVGLPWDDGGRGPGYDCWGLFVHVFNTVTGMDLDSVADQYESVRDAASIDKLIDEGRSDWFEVERGQERPLDAVLIHRRRDWHIGMVVRRGLMLHIRENQTSVVQTIPLLNSEILRFRGLA